MHSDWDIEASKLKTSGISLKLEVCRILLVFIVQHLPTYAALFTGFFTPIASLAPPTPALFPGPYQDSDSSNHSVVIRADLQVLKGTFLLHSRECTEEYSFMYKPLFSYVGSKKWLIFP